MRWLLCALILLSASPAMAAGRILALTPHACEMLYAIGAGPQIVGGSSYCDYPAAALSLPRVSSFDGINVEAALRLHPDLAVVMSRNMSGLEMLERMGVRIVVSNPDGFEDMFADIMKLAAITGHTPQAGKLVGSLRERLAKVRAKERSGTAVFYEIWPDPMLTAGGPGFITDLIREAGGRNVFCAIDVETPHVNVESVLRAGPEVIVVPLEGRSIEERRAFWERWLGKGRVRLVAIDPDLMHRPGPRLLDGLEALQQALSTGDTK